MMPQHAYHQPYQQLHPQMPHSQPYMQPHQMAMQTPQRPSGQRPPGGPTPVPGGHYVHPSGQMMPATAATPTPSSKRVRTNPAMSTATGASAATMAVMESIEDEEDTSRGDVLDHLTPREISTQRYIQHHEWLEEVFNSVYPSGNINPGSIGIEKLGGPLKPLVEGLFAKDGTPLDGKSQNEACKVVIERAKKMTSDIEAEMEELRKTHAQHLEEFYKSRMYLVAEKELRDADVDDFMVASGLTLPTLPVDRNAMAKDSHTIDEIIAEIESSFDVSILYRDVVHGWNPQPEIAELEEAQAREEALAKEAAAAAAAEAAAAKLNGVDGGDDKENTMADVAATESTSPENARYLVPVVIDKPDSNTGPSPNSNAPGVPANSGISPQPAPIPAQAAHQSSASPAPPAITEDTMMSDAPTISMPSAAAPLVPTAAATGTPGLSPTPISPFVIPSPSPAQTPHSQAGTPSLPTPLLDPTKPQTPIPQVGGTPQPGAVGTPAKPEEPPTVPGEDEIPEGFIGGDDDDLNFGGGAAEAMDLLGAHDSFTDDYM